MPPCPCSLHRLLDCENSCSWCSKPCQAVWVSVCSLATPNGPNAVLRRRCQEAEEIDDSFASGPKALAGHSSIRRRFLWLRPTSKGFIVDTKAENP